MLHRIFDNFAFVPSDSPGIAWVDTIYECWYPPDTVKRKTLRNLCLVNKRIASIAVRDLYSFVQPIDNKADMEEDPPFEWLDLNHWWYTRLPRLLYTNPSRFELVRAFLVKLPHANFHLEFVLPYFSNLRALQIECDDFDTTESRRDFCKVVRGFKELRDIGMICRNSESTLVVRKLLATLASDRIYDTLYLRCIGRYPRPQRTPIRVKALHLAGDYYPENGTINPRLPTVDRTVLEQLTLDLPRSIPDDYISDLFSQSWPALRQFHILDGQFEGFLGFGDAANTPVLRTLELTNAHWAREDQEDSQDAVRRDGPAAHDLILSMMPGSIKNLYLNALQTEDILGYRAVYNLLKDPADPLRNVTFLAMPSPDKDYKNNPDSGKRLKSAQEIAGELQYLLRSRGIRSDPMDLEEEVASHLEAFYKAHGESHNPPANGG